MLYRAPVDTSPVTEGVTLFKHQLLLLLLLLCSHFQVNNFILRKVLPRNRQYNMGSRSKLHHRCNQDKFMTKQSCKTYFFLFVSILLHVHVDEETPLF